MKSILFVLILTVLIFDIYFLFNPEAFEIKKDMVLYSNTVTAGISLIYIIFKK